MRVAALVALLPLLTVACTSNEHPADPAAPPAAPTSASGTAGNELPTQEQLDARAAQEIDAQNADAELDKLEKEIDGGG